MLNNNIQIALQNFDTKIVDFKNDLKKQLLLTIDKGEQLYKEKQLTEAIDLLKEAILVKKKYHITLSELDTAKLFSTVAVCYLSLEDNKNAYSYLKMANKIIKLNSSESQFLKIKIQINLGIVYKSFGQNQESIKTLMSAKEALDLLDYDLDKKNEVLFILNFKIGGSFTINEVNRVLILEHLMNAYDYTLKSNRLNHAAVIGYSIINTYNTLGERDAADVFYKNYENILEKDTSNIYTQTFLYFSRFNLLIYQKDLKQCENIITAIRNLKTQHNLPFLNINYIICLIEFHIALYLKDKSTRHFHNTISEEINQFITNIKSSDYLFYTEPIELILKFYKTTKYKNRLVFYDFYIEYLKKSKKTKMELDNLYFQEKYKLENIQHKLSTQIEYNEKLQEINSSLNNFAAIAAHDLKAPLRTISEFSKLLLFKYKKEFNTDDIELFEIIIQNSTNLNKLINDLLNFSSIDKNLGEQTAIDINEILLDIIEKMKSNITEAKAQIIYNELPTVLGHKTLITLLFYNIIENSIKFRNPNIPLVINITSKTENYENTTISVKDNGIGISQENISKIFEPFKKLHIDKTNDGNGIGLTFCKKIIEYYEQTIWAESEIGKGTTLLFTLNI